jgi:CRISPR/Cas system-associated exonuclease Cas4 (RecB family)
MSNLIGSIKFQKPPEGGFDPNKFAEEIEAAYLETRKTKTQTTKKTFSPSTIGYGHGNCPRYWYIAFDGAEFNETFTAQSIANMQNGTAAHDRLEKIIKATGRLKRSEVEVNYSNPPIRGFIDAVLDWDGQEVIVEVKTAKEEVYAIKQAKMAPSSNHLIQILIYMKIRNARHGVIVYENKNTQELCLIPVNVNQRNIDIVDDLFDWLREVRRAWEDRELPTRPYTKSRPACKNCPVFDTCWNNITEKGDVEIRAYEPPK